jgi:hypothetical protein
MNALNGAGGSTTEWLRHVSQQIQTFDYELHASLRILVKGEMESEQMLAFMDASVKRERMMAGVLSYVAELLKQRAAERCRSGGAVLAQTVANTGENQRLFQGNNSTAAKGAQILEIRSADIEGPEASNLPSKNGIVEFKNIRRIRKASGVDR